MAGARTSRGRGAPAGRPLRRRSSSLGVHARRRHAACSPMRCCGALRAAVERIDVMARRRAGGAIGRRPAPLRGGARRGRRSCISMRARGAPPAAKPWWWPTGSADELGLPVFLYGELTAAKEGSPVTRAELRRGGVAGLAERMAGRGAGGLRPDFGPPRMHPRAGATLVAARPPLVAFNLQLAPPASIEDARAIAALIREGGTEGLPGLRAIGSGLAGGVAQVSMNVERPLELPLAAVVQAVRHHAAVARRRAGRAGAARGAGGLPGGRAAAGLRSRSPRDRERTRLLGDGSDQAQAPDQASRATPPASSSRAAAPGASPRRPRRAASRWPGRSGAREAPGRRDRPPTWRGAFYRAMAAAVLMLLVMPADTQEAQPGHRVLPGRAADIRADQLLHRPVAVQSSAAQQGQTRRREGGFAMSGPRRRGRMLRG